MDLTFISLIFWKWTINCNFKYTSINFGRTNHFYKNTYNCLYCSYTYHIYIYCLLKFDWIFENTILITPDVGTCQQQQLIPANKPNNPRRQAFIYQRAFSFQFLLITTEIPLGYLFKLEPSIVSKPLSSFCLSAFCTGNFRISRNQIANQ